MDKKYLPKIALGAWSWGAGAAGGDQVFGNHLSENELKPVFEAAMKSGLILHAAVDRPCIFLQPSYRTSFPGGQFPLKIQPQRGANMRI